MWNEVGPPSIRLSDGEVLVPAEYAKRSIVFVVVVALAAGCASRSGVAHRLASSDVAGTAWRLVSIASGARTILLPQTSRPQLDFGRDGSILLDDTVNAVSGRYIVDNEGITISQAGTTLVGYAGNDPDKTTTIAAIDSIVFRFSNGTSRPTTHVSARRAGDVLHIRSQHYELNYRAAGPYAEPAPASPTASSR